MAEYKQADESNIYRDMLILRMRDISDVYSDLLMGYAKITINEEVFNAFISEMVVVADHILAKLEGSGEKAQHLLKEFEEFKPWLDDISIPKRDIDEQKKVHRLFRLILRAYDMLGLSNY
jgi:hypothetical protein